MPCSYQTRTISAPVEEVWSVVKSFHDMSQAPNVVNSCEKEGDKKEYEVGAKRILNGVFKETLLSYDEKNHAFSYSIDEGVAPVSSDDVKNYVGEVKLFSVTDTNETFIEWKSKWKSSSLEAEEFCHTLYVALLNDLNTTLSK